MTLDWTWHIPEVADESPCFPWHEWPQYALPHTPLTQLSFIDSAVPKLKSRICPISSVNNKCPVMKPFQVHTSAHLAVFFKARRASGWRLWVTLKCGFPCGGVHPAGGRWWRTTCPVCTSGSRVKTTRASEERRTTTTSLQQRRAPLTNPRAATTRFWHALW